MITPYRDIKSTDILAAHISGLQHSINKIESIIDMKTQTVAGHKLTAVSDQPDSSYHFRIYEGTIRNWLDTPSPRVYRNNSEVASSEYTLQPAYGVLVFHEAQSPLDVITVDINYIGNTSFLDEKLLGISPYLHSPGAWRTNSISATSITPNIFIAENLMDAFPFPVSEPTTFDAIAIKVDGGATNTKARLGIYKDNGNCYPGKLILDAGEVDTATTGVKSIPISLNLDKGLYWLTRNSNGGPSISGISNNNAINLGIDGSLTGHHSGAYRITQSYSTFPDQFSAGADLLFRTSYATHCQWCIQKYGERDDTLHFCWKLGPTFVSLFYRNCPFFRTNPKFRKYRNYGGVYSCYLIHDDTINHDSQYHA
ncbi:hypothetical protein J2S17_004897 [Cytobacillus purgationiresistens]|uniref:Uncharacterized protein n=1 Tax=Cytobacillus purgationiresistens TaxID=863449 RepID=A0ABU0ARF7_9BACI|nr:hypothetical protein [Cytobacillus purgationiresistens]